MDAADLDRLPDDGNRYEVIDGELFLTPAPSPVHEELAILSGITSRRDQVEKRAFYLRTGVAQYWIVNRWDRTIRVIAAHAEDITVSTQFSWQPAGASDALVVDVAGCFRSVRG